MRPVRTTLPAMSGSRSRGAEPTLRLRSSNPGRQQAMSSKHRSGRTAGRFRVYGAVQCPSGPFFAGPGGSAWRMCASSHSRCARVAPTCVIRGTEPRIIIREHVHHLLDARRVRGRSRKTTAPKKSVARERHAPDLSNQVPEIAPQDAGPGNQPRRAAKDGMRPASPGPRASGGLLTSRDGPNAGSSGAPGARGHFPHSWGRNAGANSGMPRDGPVHATVRHDHGVRW